MSQTTLIGLTGQAGAGKDTAAQHLASAYAFEHFAFADPIYEMLLALFHRAGISEAWATERALKEQPTAIGPSYRRLAQTLGTEWGRHTVADDLWIRVAEMQLTEARRCGLHVVISDVRFVNEAAWIRAQGGVLVRVLRRDLPPVAPHVSEREMAAIEPDHELLNHGSTATLFDQVDRLIEALRR